MPVLAMLALFALFGVHDAPAAAQRDGYDYYAIGDPGTATPGRTETALMLSGGGAWLPDVWKWFAEKSGHGHLVILHASPGDQLQRQIARGLKPREA